MDIIEVSIDPATSEIKSVQQGDHKTLVEALSEVLPAPLQSDADSDLSHSPHLFISNLASTGEIHRKITERNKLSAQRSYHPFENSVQPVGKEIDELNARSVRFMLGTGGSLTLPGDPSKQVSSEEIEKRRRELSEKHSVEITPEQARKFEQLDSSVQSYMVYALAHNLIEPEGLEWCVPVRSVVDFDDILPRLAESGRTVRAYRNTTDWKALADEYGVRVHDLPGSAPHGSEQEDYSSKSRFRDLIEEAHRAEQLPHLSDGESPQQSFPARRITLSAGEEVDTEKFRDDMYEVVTFYSGDGNASDASREFQKTDDEWRRVAMVQEAYASGGRGNHIVCAKTNRDGVLRLKVEDAPGGGEYTLDSFSDFVTKLDADVDIAPFLDLDTDASPAYAVLTLDDKILLYGPIEQWVESAKFGGHAQNIDAGHSSHTQAKKEILKGFLQDDSPHRDTLIAIARNQHREGKRGTATYDYLLGRMPFSQHWRQHLAAYTGRSNVKLPVAGRDGGAVYAWFPGEVNDRMAGSSASIMTVLRHPQLRKQYEQGKLSVGHDEFVPLRKEVWEQTGGDPVQLGEYLEQNGVPHLSDQSAQHGVVLMTPPALGEEIEYKGGHGVVGIAYFGRSDKERDAMRQSVWRVCADKDITQSTVMKTPKQDISWRVRRHRLRSEAAQVQQRPNRVQTFAAGVAAGVVAAAFLGMGIGRFAVNQFPRTAHSLLRRRRGGVSEPTSTSPPKPKP